MSLSFIIKKNKVVAAVFLFVLLIVYAEKALHSHECTKGEKQQTSFSLNYNFSSCSLCDFQPVNASGLPEPLGCSIPVIIIFQKFIPVKTVSYFTVAEVNCNRGPPVVAC